MGKSILKKDTNDDSITVKDGDNLSVGQKKIKNEVVDLDNYVSFSTDDAANPMGKKIQNQYKKNSEDVGSSDLGLHITMDGETYNVAQKKRKAHIDENNYVIFSSDDNAGNQKGKQIQKKQKSEDVGSADLGLHISMDGETYNIAQQKRKAHTSENNFVAFSSDDAAGNQRGK